MEEISKEALMIIVDENDHDFSAFGIIGEEQEMEEMDNTLPLDRHPSLRLSITSKDSIDMILDDIENELFHQYPSPPEIHTSS